MVDIRCDNVTFQNIRAVFFDKDGTLAHSESFLRMLGLRRSRIIDAEVPGVQEPLMMAFGLSETSVNPAGLLAVGSRAENEVAAAAYVAETGRDWVDSLILVRSAFQEADRYMPRKAEQTPLVEGGLNLIKSLHKAGIAVGVLSSDTTDNVHDFSQHYGITPYLTVQLGADLGHQKPAPEFLEQACAIAHVEPAETLVIGDSAADVVLSKAGRAAGCIGVIWGWSRPRSLRDADVVIHQINQLEIIG